MKSCSVAPVKKTKTLLFISEERGVDLAEATEECLCVAAQAHRHSVNCG